MPPIHRLCICSLVPLVFLWSVTMGPAVSAQDSPIVGSWNGTLDVTVAKLRLRLDIQSKGDGFAGKMISLDQGEVEISFDSMAFEGGKFEFEIKSSGVKYSGTLSEDQKMISGTFRQFGREFELDFKKTDKAYRLKLQEVWTGEMTAAGKKFDFQFRVLKDPDGNDVVKLDSFTENLTIAAERKRDGKSVTFRVPVTAAELVGELNEAGDLIEGNWKQGGREFAINLSKIPNAEVRVLARKRPQTPKPPFGYETKDFRLKVSDIDAKYDPETELAGTMTMPKGDASVPTLILISGSGPQDRDETLFGHKPFLVLADHLTTRGYGVIRYDERGVGESRGDFGNATSEILASDVEAIFRWAKKQPRVDANKIILCGHSEGGLIAPMVAARNPDVGGVIMLAGPGVNGEAIIRNQSNLIASAAGMDQTALDAQAMLLDKVLNRVRSGDPLDEEFISATKAAIEERFDDLGDFPVEASLQQSVVQMSSPWMKYFLRYEPSENLSRTKCPVLAVTGSKDLQVDPKLNHPAIKKSLELAGNEDFEIQTLDGLNHLFQECETGSPGEYASIQQTLAEPLLDTVTRWLDARYK